MNFRLALVFGLLFVVCLSLSSAEEAGKAEPEPGAEPESEPEATAEEDSKGSGTSVGKSEESKAGPNNPAAVPIAFPASVIFGMAIVAKYIL